MASMPRIEAPTVAEHHALRRAAIVSAAVDLLAREGVAGVSPAAVAAAAGLARSSIYLYFPSTGALIGAGVEETFRRSLAALEGVMSGAQTPGERIAAYVDGSLTAAIAGHQPMAAYIAADLPADCLDRVVDLHRELQAPLVKALQDKGIRDALGVAGLIGGVISAGATQVNRGERPATVRSRVQHFVTSALG